jgi:predicted MFS family arabinose efflux permease
MVGVGCLAYLAGPAGLFFAFGLFFGPLSSAFHWSREAISGYLTLSSLGYAFAAPFAGRLADRYGPRHVVIYGMFAYAIVFASQGLLTPHLWHFYALAIAIGALAPAASALTFGRVVSNWFDRRRGIALSVLACAVGFAAVVVPPVTEWLIASFGWREAYGALGIGTLLLVVGPAVSLLIDEPSHVVRERSHDRPCPSADVPPSIFQLTSERRFWVLVAMAFVVGAIYVGVLGHLVPLLTDRGMSRPHAAGVVSLLGVAAILGHLLVGTAFDRYPPAVVAAGALFASAVGVAGVGLATSGTALVLSTMLLGLALGADIDLTPYLVSRYFQLGSYSRILGLLFAAGTLATTISPLLMGRAFDEHHSYALVTTPLAGIAVLAACLTLTLGSAPAISR